MALIVLQFFLASSLIIISGSFLTRFGDRIAELTGWGRMFVGSLLLAGATSLPELMVDLKAVKLNLPDLAVGDLLGSSLFNLLILALLDFAYPSAFRGTAFSPRFLHHSLAAVLTIVLTALVGVGISAKLDISMGGVNIFAWTVLIVYLYGLRLIFRDESQKSILETSTIDPTPVEKKDKLKNLVLAFSGYFVCAAVIFGVAPYLVEAADKIATQTGLGHTFIGTTLVALTTSLPELVATLAAFRIGAPDLALGNIFGSNAFNMTLFAPLDALYPQDLFSSVKSIHIVTTMSVIAATSIAVMGQLYRKKERSRLTEPSSETVVVVIVSFLFLLFWLNAN